MLFLQLSTGKSPTGITMRQILIPAIIISLLAGGCALQPLQYVAHSPLKVAVSLQNQEATIATNISLYNPNRLTGKVQSGQLEVLLGPSSVGNIVLDTTVRVKGRSAFILPVQFTTTGAQLLNASKYAKGFFSGNAYIPYTVKGDIFIRSMLVYRKRIDVVYSDSLLLKDIQGLRQ
ncbi:MAG: hypothetical protein ABR95_11410 [Sphingobacteriales bacterium BACL12 MAG-120813-bin55]|nr:MAG: hypothetical protein ABR94_06310 [Sphingobacteriales bacterium BACL12 MAG-120802-bin5]KRP10853.1 MAG: hypothetical protein ABR95_11410 [Sphingobacteriales bacterium BACL12 MAG-120813-bin55]